MRLRAESLMRRTLAATSRPPRPPTTLSPSARNNVDTSRHHTRGAIPETRRANGTPTGASLEGLLVRIRSSRVRGTRLPSADPLLDGAAEFSLVRGLTL